MKVSATRLGLALAVLVFSYSALSLDPSTAITQYHQNVWGEGDGLPQGSVQAITQTRDGYLWVGTRDGLQVEAAFVPTEDKIALVDALSQAGMAKIEVTAFVSPQAIPASNAFMVFSGASALPPRWANTSGRLDVKKRWRKPSV